MRELIVCLALGTLFLLSGCSGPASDDRDQGGAPPTALGGAESEASALASETAAGRVPALARELSPEEERGLAWLTSRQLQSGGWGQGEESAQMGNSLDSLKEKANVADTCMAALALLRAGNLPSEGRHSAALRRAVEFVCGEVEASPEEGLSITSVQGTRVQMKIGTYVDTFLAAQLLAELKDRMGEEEGNRRLLAALDKVMDKIEKNQQADGRWDNQGWAPILTQAVAGKGLARARQAGVAVPEEMLARLEQSARIGFSSTTGGAATPGSAGIDLYADASNLSVLQENFNTYALREKDLRRITVESPDPEERQQAARQLESIEEGKKAFAQAQGAVLDRLEDPAFVAGFGSNGGEEFMSYLNISESLVLKSGPDWERWKAAMGTNLARVQNQDGSWSGHHCITGRTFCTAAALMVLLTDRGSAPGPVVSEAR